MEDKVKYEETKQLKDTPKNGGSSSDVMERIIEEVGGMGTYQRWLFVAMMPFGMFFIIVYSVQMFIAATPEQHWCHVPELQGLDIELRRNLSIPGASNGLEWDRCNMYDANWSLVLETMKPPNTSKTKPCQNGWEFLYEDIPYPTVVSERDWVCDRASNAPFAQMVFFLGSLIGCAFFGWMGDKYGRIPALIGANLIGCLGGVATVYTAGVWDFTFSRFLVGLSNDSCLMLLYILVLEYVGPSHRTWVANMSFALFCGGGGLLLVLLALLLNNWRNLILVTSLPMLIVLAVPWLVPESSRWLASKGKAEKAVKMLKKFEKINKKKIPEELMNEFVVTASQTKTSNESLLDLMRSKLLRWRMVALILICMIGNISIDAIIRMSESIGTNFFMTYALSTSAEIPSLGLVTLVLDKSGRRNMIVGTMAAAGILSFLCAFAKQGILQMILALSMRFASNMSIGAQIQITSEIIPPGVRATGNAVVHLSVYLATMFSPYIVYSGRFWGPLPLVIVGSLCIFAAALSLLLPETKGQSMPQNIYDAEKLILEESFWNRKKVARKQNGHFKPDVEMSMLEKKDLQ